MEQWTPAEAAAQSKGALKTRQVQQLCREWHDSKGASGLRCERSGTGFRTSYLIDSDDLAAFLAIKRPRGWKPGRPRGPRKKKSDGSIKEPSPVSEQEARD